MYYKFYVPSRPLIGKVILTGLGDAKAVVVLVKGKNGENVIEFPNRTTLENYEYK